MEVENTRAIIDSLAGVEPEPYVVAGVPAFNEQENIAHIILKAQKFADIVIVCDDGSEDLTGKIAERMGADVIIHESNLGYGAAIKSLFRRSLELGADILVTLDGDGQHDASEIPNILKPLTNGEADVVIGSRFMDRLGTAEMPFYRRIGAKLITKLVSGSSNSKVKDSQSGFRAYNREALRRLSIFEDGMGASVEILLEASKQRLRICEVPSTCKYKNSDVSTSSEHPLTHGIGVVMSIIRLIIEERPLTTLGAPGIAFLLAGLSFGVWLMQIYAIERLVETNIALASLSFMVIGFFMSSSAITLYAISRLSKKINGKN